MAARVVLLDLDGTVWDSYPWYSRVLERTGLTQAGEIETALWKGRSLIRLGKDLGVPRSRLIRMIKGTSDAIPLYPGVVASLARLSDRGTKLGIVTSLSGAIAVPMLARAGIDGLFQTIVHPGGLSYLQTQRTSHPRGAGSARGSRVVRGRLRR